MRTFLYCARFLSHLLAMGLCIQHGGERGSGSGTESTVELVQCTAVSKTEEAMGSLAGIDSGMVGAGDEFGTARLSALNGDVGCA